MHVACWFEETLGSLLSRVCFDDHDNVERRLFRYDFQVPALVVVPVRYG